MSNVSTEATVVACVPTAIPADQRSAHFALGRELLSKRSLSRQALENGVELTFAASDLKDVARFVELERHCCPFMNFDLSIPNESAPLSLRMTGPAGTREVIEAEFGLTNGCGCK